MEEILSLVGNYTVSAIIVGLFIWDWISNKKKIAETIEQNAKCLEEIKKTNENTAVSLELLKQQMEKTDSKIEILTERIGRNEK
jgi:hypothetical protein|nr:MAG TPA: hypothetical protein [Caudoviricetes sp.]